MAVSKRVKSSDPYPRGILRRIASREFSNIHHQVQGPIWLWAGTIDTCSIRSSPYQILRALNPRMHQPHDLASKKSSKRLCRIPFFFFGKVLIVHTMIGKIQSRAGCTVAHLRHTTHGLRAFSRFCSLLEGYNPTPIYSKQPNQDRWIFSPDIFWWRGL